MKTRPILFKGEMVRAILEGRKTMTRRLVKPQPVAHTEVWDASLCKVAHPPSWFDAVARRCPYGQPGDHLWVKETWRTHPEDQTLDPIPVDYQATPCSVLYPGNTAYDGCKWKSSLFMPRWASRITLEIVSVNVERLQDIADNNEDAKAEGVVSEPEDAGPWGMQLPPEWWAFKKLWDSINGKTPGASWKDNPWVWVIEFKRVKP